MKSWLAQGSSGRRMTLLPGTTFLHINGALISWTRKKRNQILRPKKKKPNLSYTTSDVLHTIFYQNGGKCLSEINQQISQIAVMKTLAIIRFFFSLVFKFTTVRHFFLDQDIEQRVREEFHENIVTQCVFLTLLLTFAPRYLPLQKDCS